jgi:hypothetical protein
MPDREAVFVWECAIESKGRLGGSRWHAYSRSAPLRGFALNYYI